MLNEATDNTIEIEMDDIQLDYVLQTLTSLEAGEEDPTVCYRYMTPEQKSLLVDLALIRVDVPLARFLELNEETKLVFEAYNKNTSSMMAIFTYLNKIFVNMNGQKVLIGGAFIDRNRSQRVVAHNVEGDGVFHINWFYSYPDGVDKDEFWNGYRVRSDFNFEAARKFIQKYYGESN